MRREGRGRHEERKDELLRDKKEDLEDAEMLKQASAKVYQKWSSFTSQKRKTQENTLPEGPRGEAGNRRIQKSRGFDG